MTILSHFFTFCALSFDYQATQRPHICPQVNFRKSQRGFRHNLSHWLTFGSDITAQSISAGNEPRSLIAQNDEILKSALKSAETPQMALISISNDKNVNLSKFERNPCENRRFQFFVAGTPDSRKTFFKMAPIPLRMNRFSIFQQIPVDNVPNFQNLQKNRKSDHSEKSYGP